jgi:hypothetical protein
MADTLGMSPSNPRVARCGTFDSMPAETSFDGSVVAPEQIASVPLRHNGDVEWDDFAPEAYWSHNYRQLRAEDDGLIIDAVAAFFSERLGPPQESCPLRGIDVGAGSNLYPALGMLPWCQSITLVDPSRSNVEWLERQRAQGLVTPSGDSWTWLPFWQRYVDADPRGVYKEFGRTHDPRQALAAVQRTRQGSVFDLNGQWGVGTMFFVAESMTNFEGEFELATGSFLNVLAPGAPFAAAFMDKSVGYLVGDKSFPAVREVDVPRIRAVLERHRATAEVVKVDVPASDPLRDGYEGMIIALGTTAAS